MTLPPLAPETRNLIDGELCEAGNGGTFDNLTRKLKKTLEGSTKWKVSMGPVGDATGPPVRGYKQIVGEKL